MKLVLKNSFVLSLIILFKSILSSRYKFKTFDWNVRWEIKFKLRNQSSIWKIPWSWRKEKGRERKTRANRKAFTWTNGTKESTCNWIGSLSTKPEHYHIMDYKGMTIYPENKVYSWIFNMGESKKTIFMSPLGSIAFKGFGTSQNEESTNYESSPVCSSLDMISTDDQSIKDVVEVSKGKFQIIREKKSHASCHFVMSSFHFYLKLWKINFSTNVLMYCEPPPYLYRGWDFWKIIEAGFKIFLQKLFFWMGGSNVNRRRLSNAFPL